MSIRDTPEQAPKAQAEPSAADYEAASQWAETATFEASDFIPDQLAPDYGRDLIRSARVGRPALDPAAPGQESPVRQVRLGASLNAELDQLIAARKQRGERSTASDVIRAALTNYLKTEREAHSGAA